MQRLETDVAIVGGGPAGMLAGLLLSQKGIRVHVLEKNADFQREYRGEVLMPRFVQMMKQIHLHDHLEKYPHLKLDGFEFYAFKKLIATIRVDQISKEEAHILWMPQPILLNALLDKAKTFPAFQISFHSTADSLIHENGRVVGVRGRTKEEPFELRAKLTIGCDGRISTVRHDGGFEFEYKEHEFDILWFTIPKPADFGNHVRAFVGLHHNFLSLPKYPNELQCGMILKAGEYAEFRKKGIESLSEAIRRAHPAFKSFADNLKDFGPFNLLAAKAERMKDWSKEGVLLIGDAAHTCSPAGAIGVSVAVGTAIVAADVIVRGFQNGDLSAAFLSEIQRLRIDEVKEIQQIQKGVAGPVSARTFWGRLLVVLGATLAVRTPLFKGIQRRLMVQTKPLPIQTLF